METDKFLALAYQTVNQIYRNMKTSIFLRQFTLVCTTVNSSFTCL